MVERASSRRKDGDEEDAAAKAGAEGRRAPAPKFDKKTIALVYDFDGTLSPKPMQEYAFLPKINTDPEAFWAESNRLAKEHAADPLITYMHLLYKKAKEQATSASTAATWSRRASTSSCIPASRPGSTPSATTSRARPEPRRGAAPLPDLVGPDRDHRGHLDPQALPQRVRLRILVRGLRPALPQARHHRHRQDAIPVPHQQGRGGPGREHQPAHARGARGRSRSPT